MRNTWNPNLTMLETVNSFPSVYQSMFILSTIIRVAFLPIWHMYSQTSPSNTWVCRHQGNVIQRWDEVKGHQQRSGNSGCLGWCGGVQLLNKLFGFTWMNVIDSDVCRISSNNSLFAILMRQSPFLSFLHTHFMKKVSHVYWSNRIMSHLCHNRIAGPS